MWSDVELLINEDTNTVRYEGVSREDSGSGLYQVDTLVRISSSNKVIILLGSNWSIVVVDNTVILFDQSYQTILLLLHFETDVDAIDVCLERRFLVVCERNGNLHLIYVPHKKILLTRVRISSLQIRNLPSMTVCYSLDVSSVSCLVQTKTNMFKTWMLMDLISLVFPPFRLSRLLHKHMFEEAEKFAITFQLDLELVYKVKLDFVLEQLDSASAHGSGQDVWSKLVDEAKNNLMKISDEQYVVDYCLKAPWPTFETTEKMLNHASSRYSSLQIQEALARLATFCSLHGLENFNGIAWIEFLNSTEHLGNILTHLRDGDMKGAQLLCNHTYEIRLNLFPLFFVFFLEALLCAIPEDLSSQDLCPWLRTVLVPFVRKVLPRGQKILAKWLEQKARNLELTEKGSWPQNGLDMAVLGIPSLWTWKKSLDEDYGSDEVENLRSLVSNLRQLLDLHQKYSCRLSLSVLEKGTVWSVVFFMLDKVPAPELIAATVENSVLPYTTEHQIPFDELLLRYIKDLLERCSSQTTTLFTEWEAKAVAVLGCMTDSDVSFSFLPSRFLTMAISMEPLFCPNTSPFSTSGPRLTSCHRTRALLCLVRLADAATLEAKLQIPRTKNYLKCYIFVSQLEALNIPYTVQSFLNSPKEGLVKGLWKNHSHEPQAVRLVADLCLEYQVYDSQLWNSLLQKLLGFNLISHLQKVLEAIVAVPALWEVRLQKCFQDPNMCPFLLNLDLIGIANRFAQFNLPAFALGTLLLIPCASKKEQQIQGFLSMCNPVTVLEQVEELMNTGELAGIPSQIMETVLTFISQNGQHQKLMKTKHFSHLKQLIFSRGQTEQVKDLVDYLASQNW
uniref:Kinetochore associated 1 n=1 Tax=Oryzias latipes TaxID=8090 RepID=A0A3P9IYC9_ORYLA